MYKLIVSTDTLEFETKLNEFVSDNAVYEVNYSTSQTSSGNTVYSAIVEYEPVTVSHDDSVIFAIPTDDDSATFTEPIGDILKTLSEKNKSTNTDHFDFSTLFEDDDDDFDLTINEEILLHLAIVLGLLSDEEK